MLTHDRSVPNFVKKGKDDACRHPQQFANEVFRIPFVRFDGSMSAARRKAVLEQFSEPLVKDVVDEDETEPDTEDEEAYREYMERKRQQRKGKARAVSRFLESGQPRNPVVMLISLKVLFSKVSFPLLTPH